MRLEHWIYTIPLRLRSLFKRKRVEQELDEELEFHLQQRVEGEIAKGANALEARYIALRAMQGLAQKKEECRDARRVNIIENLGHDLRYAGRMLRKSPVFTGVAILSLALGIGANTAVFSLIDALLLRPLPVPHSDRLISIFAHTGNGRPRYYFTYAIFNEVAKQSRIFSGVFTWAGHQFQMRSGPDMVHVDGVLASGEYFSTLGVPASIGRTLTPADDQPGGGKYGPVTVISDAFWSRQFQRNPSAVGSGLTLDRVRFTVVGVMPPGFFGAEVGTKPDIWVPLWTVTQLGDTCINSRSCWWLIMMARLKPGVSQVQAQAALKVISPQVTRAALPTDWDRSGQQKFLQWRLFTVPGANGWSFLRTQFSNPLAILMILVAVVLLIACANMANLLLARASARYREIAVRLAMGAGRSRIIRQLLTESLLLSLMGAAAGLLFVLWTTRLLVVFLAANGPGPGFGQNTSFDLHPDWRVILFTSVAAIGSGLLFGFMPALRATRIGISASLKERAHNVRGDEGRVGIGRWLVGFQAALSVLLVAGAGLFAGSLVHLLTLNPGFDPKDVTVIGIDTDKRPEKGTALIHLYSRMLERLNSIPGVRAASLLWFTPLTDSGWDDYLDAPGGTNLPSPQRDTDINLVGPRFFETMQIPLLEGRDFGASDTAASEKVGIINQLATRRLFPHANAIGQHVILEKKPIRIVGVVGNTKYMDLREQDPLTLYLPYTQSTDNVPSLSFIIKTSNNAAIYSAFRAVLRQIAPDVPIGVVKTMQQQLDDSLGRERLMASLSVFFGVLALLLTSIGLYGILGYTVSRRTGEIGVRMALGARRHDVIWLILRETASHIAIGTAVGVLAVLALSKRVASLLYGIQPNDPRSLTLAVAVLISTALLASYLPARRASHLDPMLALREE
ncbi:MAG TPA: ABC transporter permease [Bryobacteraceae bacterium]|nr:ABC transporter permease [Bryobacteraceae bacterium]